MSSTRGTAQGKGKGAAAELHSMDLYGPFLEVFHDQLPQFALERHVAQALIEYEYGGGPPMEAEPMRVFFSKEATAMDVERVAHAAGLEYDPGAETPAQRVASDPQLRAALAGEGFDAFADYSVLENAEPFQVVVFEASRARPVDMAIAEAEAEEIRSALPKRRVLAGRRRPL